MSSDKGLNAKAVSDDEKECIVTPNVVITDPLHEYYELFQVRDDDWIREELTEFFEDLELSKYKKSELSHRIQRKVLTEEGFSQSLEKLILNQFYQLALLDNFKGISETNYSFLQLYRIVTEYKFFNTRQIEQLFETDEYRGLDLESKVNFYINQAKLPTFSPCQKGICDPQNALGALTKYVNISLALTVYSYLCYEAEKERLAWSCLTKAKELFAYATALQVFLNSDQKLNISLGKVRGYRRQNLQFELFLSFVELELLTPDSKDGWLGVEQASEKIAERFESQMMRIYFLHECKKDYEKKFNKALKTLIAQWIVKYDSLRYVFEKNRANQNDYEFLGHNYYPLSPAREWAQQFSLGEFKSEPRPTTFRKPKTLSRLSISKETLEELEEKSFLYSQLKVEHEKLKSKVFPAVSKLEGLLDSAPKEDVSLKEAQIEFLLKELRKRAPKIDHRGLLNDFIKSMTTTSVNDDN
jgi:hypothetical protein